jgi:hypothetical protein
MGLRRVLRDQSAGERAGGAVLVVYNLWSVFARLLEPGRHVEAAGSRKWFMVIAAKLVKNGSQYEMQISAQGAWWEGLRRGYRRVLCWLASTAPQLRLAGGNLASGPPLFTHMLPLNCGI